MGEFFVDRWFWAFRGGKNCRLHILKHNGIADSNKNAKFSTHAYMVVCEVQISVAL